MGRRKHGTGRIRVGKVTLYLHHGAWGMTGNDTQTRPETQLQQIEAALRRWRASLAFAREWPRFRASGSGASWRDGQGLSDPADDYHRLARRQPQRPSRRSSTTD